MAETDILNPANWQLGGFVFNPNPSYGFSRKPTNNRLLQRPRLGPWITRDVGNGGHIFPLSWVNTDITTAMRVVRFYHDFKSGYFTFINPDWSNRHFVGRFTAEPEAIETANGKWTIQGATFEEVPTARMLCYPNDWTNDGHPINVVDDFFPNGSPAPLVALSSSTGAAWVLQISPTYAGASATTPTAYEAFNVTPVAGDFAQMQYVGWGFQMTFRLAPTLGNINILLDEVALVTDLDLSTGALSGAHGGAASAQVGLTLNGSASVTVTVTNIPLDMHRVKVLAPGNAGAGTGVSVLYPALQYIY